MRTEFGKAPEHVGQVLRLKIRQPWNDGHFNGCQQALIGVAHHGEPPQHVGDALRFEGIKLYPTCPSHGGQKARLWAGLQFGVCPHDVCQGVR